MKKLYRSLALKIRPKHLSKPLSQTVQTTGAVSAPSDNDDSLHLIHEGDETLVDIVALHGQGGSWNNSWTDHVTGCFWLRDLLPQVVPNARVISYGYKASKSSITVAEEFLVQLVGLRQETCTNQRPIIFLAHSFGGILIKGILAMSHNIKDKSDFELISSSTFGILFFGIPRDTEKSFNNLALALTDNENNSPEIQALNRDFRWLQESNATYSVISKHFEVKCFVESADGVSRVISNDNGERLDKEIDGVVQISKTHGQMIRFPDADDVDFKKVATMLSDMATEALKRLL